MQDSLEALIIASAVGAAFLITHAIALWVTLHSDLSLRWKLLSLIPFITPVAAWRGRRRSAAIAWALVLIAYIVVRLLWLNDD